MEYALEESNTVISRIGVNLADSVLNFRLLDEITVTGGEHDAQTLTDKTLSLISTNQSYHIQSSCHP